MRLGSKKIFNDSLIIGAALFSMFFGAGNMIFPPYLGFGSGKEWLLSFFGYFATDIGLVILAVYAIVVMNGQKPLLGIAGDKLGVVILFIVVMCLGPVISIPRTAATTYELSIVPIMGKQNFPWFYIVFFGLVLLICLNKGKIIDFIGKVLTPLLLAGLLVLIIKGLLTPVGTIELGSRVASDIGEGIKAGYQSMDVLASIMFGAIVINSAVNKGYSEQKNRTLVILTASILAGLGLFVVYLGLTFLGATASGNHTMHITRSELLTDIIVQLFPGKGGLLFFGIVAGLACLSTAVALVGAAAEYIERICRGKVNYRIIVVALCVFDAVIATVGVERLVTFAAPLLSLIYPPILVIVALSFLRKHIGVWSARLTVYAAFLCGAYDMVAGFGYRIRVLDSLPLSDIGLAWVFPCLLIFVLTFTFEKIQAKNRSV